VGSCFCALFLEKAGSERHVHEHVERRSGVMEVILTLGTAALVIAVFVAAVRAIMRPFL
jgi:hypothetical protein